MRNKSIFNHDSSNHFIIAALRLPPFFGSSHSEAYPLSKIIDFSLKNVEYANSAGIDAICIQDIGNYPVSRDQSDYLITTANLTAIGCAIRSEFPNITLGVSTISPGATQSLVIANAIGAEFVRIKVFVGAVVRSEGMVEGCAHEAHMIREKIKAENLMILADIHDRDGTPVGQPSLQKSIFDAVVLGRADGIILTGGSIEETAEMLKIASDENLNIPVFVGGGVNTKNVHSITAISNGLFVSKSLWVSDETNKKQRMWSDWDIERIKAFMHVVRQ